ncbi:Hypothetical protein TRBSAP_052 [Escherichia phage vB_Eco_SAP]
MHTYRNERRIKKITKKLLTGGSVIPHNAHIPKRKENQT